MINMKIAAGAVLIVLGIALGWVALTLALFAQDAGTTSLTARVIGLWALVPLVAGIVLGGWGVAEK